MVLRLRIKGKEMLNVIIFIKKYKKVIGISIGVLIIICSTMFITNYISKANTTKLYNELNSRYSSLEESNKDLREVNIKLESNNKLLREQLSELNSNISRANIIVGDFEEELGNARSTIERLEITVGFIDKIVDQLPNEIILLEESNIDK